MRVITRKRVLDAQARHKDSATALAAWYRIVSKGRFADFAALKAGFGGVDRFAHLCIFDIGGNKLRLIAAIHFNRQMLFVRDVLTHKEYDSEGWKKRELAWKQQQEKRK